MAFPHGWLCQAALLLNVRPIGNRLFLEGPEENVGGLGPEAPPSHRRAERWRMPAVTLSGGNLGCGLASLWNCARQTLCQSTKPASHARLSCSSPTRSSPTWVRGHFWARQWLWP